MDLLLDPFPYNGAVTSADALWMGVPVLSLAGDSYVSRQGLCLLTQLGLTDYLCASPDDYVAKALALAGEPQNLIALSAGLRSRLERSPWMDYARFAQAFGQTIRRAWKQP